MGNDNDPIMFHPALTTIESLGRGVPVNAIVKAKLREIQKRDVGTTVTIRDLAESDELEILREYSVTLYKEYRTLRTVFLENMVVNNRSVGMKYNSN